MKRFGLITLALTFAGGLFAAYTTAGPLLNFIRRQDPKPAASAPCANGQCPAVTVTVTMDADAPKKLPNRRRRPRGHKPAPPAVRAKLHADAFKRHGAKKFPKATAPAFDCRAAFGNVLPVDDQGDCGDCFMISALDACSMALAKAGVLKPDESARLSGQYGLDCHGDFGGCDGGDEAQVIDYVKSTGWILTSAYGPYTQSAGPCKSSPGAKLYKIGDYGYCTPSQQEGLASTQDMKDALAATGPISVAFDASECDGYTNGTMRGSGGNVDHAVLCIGWDDNHDNGDGSKGAFLGLNQWGKDWGIGGTFWIKYGADSWGTEAIWLSAATVPVPPAPTPTPSPTPEPPVNPPQPTPPAPTSVSGTLTLDVPAESVTFAGLGRRVAQPVDFTGTITFSDGSAVQFSGTFPAASVRRRGFRGFVVDPVNAAGTATLTR